MNEFIAVFGQRYVGLIDNANTYTTYRVPRPQAPYPQDYIVDQQGIVQYWSDEYDPQKIIKIIDRLLISEIKEKNISANPSNHLNLSISPNPTRKSANLTYALKNAGNVKIVLYDVTGRVVETLVNMKMNAGAHTLGIKAQNLPAGVYFVRMETPDGVSSTPMTIVQ